MSDNKQNGVGSMTREQLLNLHAEICDRAAAIMKAKNHDYCDNGNPFSNFRASSVLGVDPKIALLVRMLDKVKRLATFCNQGKLLTPNESERDAVLDIVNYAILFAGMVQEDAKCATYHGVADEE